jgi:dUTP pyrophosphatase
MDICAAIKEPIVLPPGEIVLVATGFSMAIPPGFEAQIRPRSGLAVKHGIGIVNAPGTIDADYRGEVRIALINFGKNPYTIKRGDRIAQMIIQKVYRVEMEEVETLEETARNTGGFGHTGT